MRAGGPEKMLRRQGVGQKRHLPKGLEPRSVTSSLALMALGPWTNHPGTLDKSPWDPGQTTLGPWTNHFRLLAITFPTVNKGMGPDSVVHLLVGQECLEPLLYSRHWEKRMLGKQRNDYCHSRSRGKVVLGP